MKRSILPVSILMITGLLLSSSSSCGSSGLSQAQRNSNSQNNNLISVNPNFVNSTSVNAIANSFKATNSASGGNTVFVETPVKPLPGPIEGSYSSVRTDTEGTSSNSSLKIAKQGSSYRFDWIGGGVSYAGSGTNIGNTVVVSYTKEKSGVGCGAAIYKVASNGSLDGKIVHWENGKIENEQLYPWSSDEFLNARYTNDPTQSGPDMDIDVVIAFDEKKGEYHFIWSNFEDREGWGVKMGNIIAAPFGENHCAYAFYSVESDGSIVGKFSDQLGNDIGTEILTKK